MKESQSRFIAGALVVGELTTFGAGLTVNGQELNKADNLTARNIIVSQNSGSVDQKYADALNKVLTKETPAIKELKHKALQYVSGGEFMNAETFTNPLEKLSVGATVVYSSEKNKAAEKKEVTKYQSKIQKDDVVYCIGGKTYLVRSIKNMMTDMNIKKENVYQLKDMAEITFPQLCYFPAIRFDYKSKTLVATDFLKETHDYDPASKKWVEKVDGYVMLGDPNQRIKKNLNKFLSTTIVEYNQINRNYDYFNNPLSLDKDEVQKYCETGSDKDIKSFKILNDAKGNPAFFVVMEGECGVGEKMFENISNAIKRLNEIDPTIVNLMCDKEGMNCVAYDINGSISHGFFETRQSSVGSYNIFPFGEITFINKNYSGFTNGTLDQVTIDRAMIEIMFVESRALNYKAHTFLISRQIASMPDVLSNIPGVMNEEADKYRFLLKYLDEKWLPAKVLTKSEYRFLKNNAEAKLKSYDPSYILTYQELDDINFIPEN